MRALSVFIRNHHSPTDHRGDFGKTDAADFSVTQMKLERHKGNRPQMLLNFLDHRSSLHRSTITQQPSRSASNALAQPLDWANQATIVAATPSSPEVRAAPPPRIWRTEHWGSRRLAARAPRELSATRRHRYGPRAKTKRPPVFTGGRCNFADLCFSRSNR